MFFRILLNAHIISIHGDLIVSRKSSSASGSGPKQLSQKQSRKTWTIGSSSLSKRKYIVRVAQPSNESGLVTRIRPLFQFYLTAKLNRNLKIRLYLKLIYSNEKVAKVTIVNF